MGKVVKKQKPKKTLKDTLKKTAEIKMTASEELAYQDYADRKRMCEIDVLDAEYDGRISAASEAQKKLDKLELRYESNPKFAKRYEYEREERYCENKREALSKLDAGNKDEYMKIMSDVNDDARFMSKEQLSKCDGRINDERLAQRNEKGRRSAQAAALEEDRKFLKTYGIDINRGGR